MKCSGCHNIVEATQNFCTHCGKSLKKFKCSACKAPLSPTAKFCGECGHSAVKQADISFLPSEAPKDKFLFVPHPSNEADEGESEIYLSWLAEKLLPLFDANDIVYKSPGDFKPGNPVKQQMEVMESCTYTVVPVCGAVCSQSNLQLLSLHFTPAKPPIVLLLPKDIAGEMSKVSVGLHQYNSYSCKTDRDIEKTVSKIAEFMCNKDKTQQPQNVPVMESDLRRTSLVTGISSYSATSSDSVAHHTTSVGPETTNNSQSLVFGTALARTDRTSSSGDQSQETRNNSKSLSLERHVARGDKTGGPVARSDRTGSYRVSSESIDTLLDEEPAEDTGLERALSTHRSSIRADNFRSNYQSNHLAVPYIPSDGSSARTEDTPVPSRHTGDDTSVLERPRTQHDMQLVEYHGTQDTVTTENTDDSEDTSAHHVGSAVPSELVSNCFLAVPTPGRSKVQISSLEDGEDAIPKEPTGFRSYDDLADVIYIGNLSAVNSIKEQTMIRYLLMKLYSDCKPKRLVCLGLIARYTIHEDVRMCALTYLSKALGKTKPFDQDYISEMKLLQETIAPNSGDIDKAWGQKIKENAAMLVLKSSRKVAMVMLIHSLSQKDTAELESLMRHTSNCLEIVGLWKNRLNLTCESKHVIAEEKTLHGISEAIRSIMLLEPSHRSAYFDLKLKLVNFTKSNKKSFSFVSSAKPAVKIALVFAVSAQLCGRFSEEMFDLEDTLYHYVKKDKTMSWTDNVVLLEDLVEQVEALKETEHLKKIVDILVAMLVRCKKALGKAYPEQESEVFLQAIAKPLLFHPFPCVRENIISAVFRFVKKTDTFTDLGVSSMENYSRCCIQNDLLSYRVHVKERIKEVQSQDGKQLLTVFTGKFGNHKDGVEIHCLYPRTKSESQNMQGRKAFDKVVEILQKLQTTRQQADCSVDSTEYNIVKMLAYMWPGNGISYYILHVGSRYQSLSSYMKDRVLQENPNPVVPAQKKEFALSMISAVKYCHKRGVLVRNITLGDFVTCKEDHRRTVKLYNLHMAEIDDFDDTGITREKDENLPLLWLAPESIFTGKFNKKSDVFSLAFAILELYSDGIHPYQEMGQASAKAKIITILKYKLLPERRPGVIEEVYIVLLMCLLPDPVKRLTLEGLYSYFLQISDPTPQGSNKSQDVREITKELLRNQSNEPEMGIPDTLADTHSWEDMWARDDTTDVNLNYHNFMAGHFSYNVKDSEFGHHDKPKNLLQGGLMWTCVVKRNFPQAEINQLKSVCSDREENKYVAVISKICKADPLICERGHMGMQLSLGDYDTLLHFALKEKLTAFEKKDIYMSICRGMKYLHDHNMIHCSLQARNIYVAKRSGNKIDLRIGQLNRMTLLHMDSTDNNMTEAVAKPFDHLPEDILRWCPLETHEMGLMSIYSDVAQFGYTVWEVEKCNTKDETFPEKQLVPYAYLPIEKIPDAQRQRQDLPKPEGCEEWVDKLIKICVTNPKCGRPLFDEIYQILAERNPKEHDVLNLQKRHTYCPSETNHLKRSKVKRVRSERAKLLSVALQEESETVQLRRESCPKNLHTEGSSGQVVKKKWTIGLFSKKIAGKNYSKAKDNAATNTGSANQRGRYLAYYEAVTPKGDHIYESVSDLYQEPTTSYIEAAFSTDSYDSVSCYTEGSVEEAQHPLTNELKRALLERDMPLQIYTSTTEEHMYLTPQQSVPQQVETVHDMTKNYPLHCSESGYVPTTAQPSLSHSLHHDSSHPQPEEEENVYKYS